MPVPTPREPRTRVAVAGATGALGRCMLPELQRRGYRTRAIARDAARLGRASEHVDECVVVDLLTASAHELEAACRDVDVVFSAAGASTSMMRTAERRGFHNVDYVGNSRLLDAALTVGVPRFVYVSVFAADRLGDLAYVRAHERFVERLRASALRSTVVRANGFFSGYLELLRMARRGRAVLLGDGRSRSNAIHEADLASVCVAAIEGSDNEISVGGPELHTRREEAELAFRALGSEPRVFSLPTAVARLVAACMRPFDRRRSEVLRFLLEVMTADMVAPGAGTRRLADFYGEQVAGGAAATSQHEWRQGGRACA